MKATTDKIIADALKDPEVYKKMAAEEDRFWSKTFTDEGRVARTKEAQVSARHLRKNRDNFAAAEYFRNKNKTIDTILVLGCGGGRAERGFYSKGMGSSFHGVDIAEGAINRARNIAKKENLPITYEVADLNSVKLSANTYDLVWAQNFLHHIVDLEHLFKEIWKCLKPNGNLYIQDFVGETQFQWSEKRLKVTTEILNLLPEKYKQDYVNQRKVRLPQRPEPGKLCSPFEAIRSGEILPELNKWFDVEKEVLSGSIRYHVLPLGVLPSYNENEDSKLVFELLRYLDRLLVDEKVLPPTAAQMVMRKKPRDQVKSLL